MRALVIGLKGGVISSLRADGWVRSQNGMGELALTLAEVVGCVCDWRWAGRMPSLGADGRVRVR